MNEVSMLTVVREMQIPLLAGLLITGCTAKARYTVETGTIAAGTAPAVTFPLGSRSRRPAVIALCAVEFALGAGLLVTAGQTGAGMPALATRAAVALLFGTAAGALYVLRACSPGTGCGCFGELSRTPVGWRVIVRAVLLCTAALSLLGAPPVRMPSSAGQAWLTLVVIVAEFGMLLALSPEASQFILRFSQAEPCEVREVPVARTLSALHASAQWRRYRRVLVATAPADVWREGCWRFVVYPAVLASRRVEVVFAVHLAGRGAPVRVGVVDTGTDVTIPRQREPLQFSKLV